MPAILAFCTGFISLSMEILWIRLFSFANQTKPQAFAFVLAVYLIGIAFGAMLGKFFCKRQYDLWLVSGVALLAASVINYLAPWIYVDAVFADHRLLAAGTMMVLTSFMIAIVFPIAHHLGAQHSKNNVGKNLSRVYVANILGATLGPLVTSLLLLSIVTTQQGFLICSALTFIVAICCLLDKIGMLATATASLLLMLQVVLAFNVNKEMLLSQVAIKLPGTIKVLGFNENQYGIITVYQGKQKQHVIVGGNAYDGDTNLDPRVNSNHINRVIVMSALVDQPKRVLVIGLSVGSWLTLVTTFPGVEAIDVLEINPGYKKVIAHYPDQWRALHDPRVNLYFTDGRRWLNAHPDNKYDMVIINTTYHWRAYTANLLSQQFLQLVKAHMNKDAVLEFNTTQSPDAVVTAQSVFNHAYLYENFIIAADFDWRKKLFTAAAENKLASLQLNGKPLYHGDHKLIHKHLQEPIATENSAAPWCDMFGRKIEIITDMNIINEYKYGRTL